MRVKDAAPSPPSPQHAPSTRAAAPSSLAVEARSQTTPSPAGGSGHRLGTYAIQPPSPAATPAIQRRIAPIQLGRDETKGKKAKARALARRKQRDIKAFKTGQIGNRQDTDHIKRPSGVTTRAQEEDAVLPIFSN